MYFNKANLLKLFLFTSCICISGKMLAVEPVLFDGTIEGQKLDLTQDPQVRSYSTTFAAGTFGAAAGTAIACVAFPFLSLPVLAVGAMGVASGAGARMWQRSSRRGSHFHMELNGGLQDAIRKHRSMNGKLFTLARFDELGRDLARSTVYINENVLFNIGDRGDVDANLVYSEVLNGINAEIPEQLRDDAVVLLQVQLALETSGQLYNGSSVGSTILHALPTLGFPRFSSQDYDEYVKSSVSPRFVPTGSESRRPDCELEPPRHINRFSVESSGEKHKLVFTVTRNSGLMDLSKPHTKTGFNLLNKNLVITMRVEFDLPSRSGLPTPQTLTMPTAYISYDIVDRELPPEAEGLRGRVLQH
ncbi:MAG: hypothetical protein KA436_12190 [Oligoflexales bacterium]|nr:hypothetical protein [Oligoflexales bacterium]